MDIIKIFENNLIIDFEKYRIAKINKKYAELKEKLNKLEQYKLNLESSVVETNRLILMTKQELEKIEFEIIKDIK